MADFKPRICTWEDLNYTDAGFILNPDTSNDDLSLRLDVILDIQPSGEDVREAKRNLITRDLFYYTVLFARKQGLAIEQLSALFTITKVIHKLCISTPYDNTRSCFNLLQEMMICHSVHRPPYSIQLYSLDQVKQITDYILQSYFKNFKLYKYAFTKRVLMDLKIKYEGVEDTPHSSQILLEEITDDQEKREAKEENGDDIKEETDKTLNDQSKDEEEEEILTPEQQQLKDLISQTLDDHLKKLKITVEKELGDSDKRLSERLGLLESEIDTKEKVKKGK